MLMFAKRLGSWPALAALLILLFPLADRAAAAQPPPVEKRRGNWEGSWAHRDRDQVWVVLLRSEGGRLQAKLLFEAQTHAETFETDWNGVAEYSISGQPARFSLTLDEVTPDRILGRWSWDRSQTWIKRVEESPFLIERSYDGRRMHLEFQGGETKLERDGRTRVLPMNHGAGFMKVSKRVVRWEEIF